jgi:hypothetical protein
MRVLSHTYMLTYTNTCVYTSCEDDIYNRMHGYVQNEYVVNVIYQMINSLAKGGEGIGTEKEAKPK